ncbi:MAG: CoA-binding protein, partial [Anaerolineales bacterium]|nr:CoA-binding protein [Anaerolineales bacterium]
MLEGLFDARRIALVGVSDSEGNLGRFAAANLFKFGFVGELFLIGRREGNVLGHPVLKSLDDIPGPIDMVALLVPRGAV